MRILLLGGGGREHAMAWKISQSPRCAELFIAPGNAGTALCGSNADLDILNFEQVGVFAKSKNIDMLVVGPEAPLVKGIADHFKNDAGLRHIYVMGPEAAGARLEGSKAFAKTFMEKHGIPTAAYRSFDAEQLTEAIDFIENRKPPYVLKADGLAAGKGVVITNSKKEARTVIHSMLEEKLFGEASSTVVVEEFLSGEELSVFVATDGKTYCLLPVAKDYKRAGENDSGPNTGGMGAVSTMQLADKELMQRIEERVIIPTINGLKTDGIPYCGFIFFGLMIVNKDPFVIEYNVRLGDPETEVIIPRLRSDFVELMLNCCTGKLENHLPDISPKTAVTVMLCSGGYPGSYQKGYTVSIPEKTDRGQIIFAGVRQSDNRLITSGGRVIAVTTLANDVKQAVSDAYTLVRQVNFVNMYFRKDIGKSM